MTSCEIIVQEDAAKADREILASKASVIVMTTPHTRVKTPSWEEKIARFVMANPQAVVCPAVLPIGSCSFRKLAYGGCLDVLAVRGGHAVVLEPRWNVETPKDGTVECVMGGVYAFHSEWYRNIGGFSGMKGCGSISLVAISLRTRLAGGSCVVLTDVVSEQSFGQEVPTEPGVVAYNKIRLAMSALPLGITTIIPAVLAGAKGTEEIMKLVMSDMQDIHKAREILELACGCSLAEAATRAGISFGPFQKAATF